MMKRKLLFLSLLVFTFCGGMATAGSINGNFDGFAIVKVFGGGKELQPDKVPAINYKGSTMVPLGLLRQLGVTVEWNQAAYSATVKLPPPRAVYKLTEAQLEELKKAVYLVYAEHPDPTKVSQGSGFIVNGMLITNYHVGGDSAWTKAMIDGNWQQTSSYAFANKDIDLMGFKVSGGRQLPIATEVPETGDPVYSIGFPNGEIKVSEGKVYSVYDFNGLTRIVHSAETDNGSSGGALVNGKGELIGVNHETLDANGETISITIPIKYVEELNK